MVQKNKTEVYNNIYNEILGILLSDDNSVKKEFIKFCKYCKDKAIAMNLTEEDVAHFVTQVIATEHLTNILFSANIVEKNPMTIAMKPLIKKVKERLTLAEDAKNFYKKETEKILRKYVEENK